MRQGNGTPIGGRADAADEHTSLLARPLQNSEGNPLWEDSRAFVRWPAKVAHTVWQTLASNIVNVLLVFVPVGIIAGAVGLSPTVVFIINFLAIIPLASLLSFATEELSLKTGQTLGGLLNATFGNAVELIVRPHIFQTHVWWLSHQRLVSLHSRMARFASCNPACWVPFCRIFSWSWAAASSRAAGSTKSRVSTKLWLQQCRHLWLSPALH